MRSYSMSPIILIQIHNSRGCHTRGLVTTYGEERVQNGRGGGHVKFYPYEKGGRNKFKVRLWWFGADW